MGSWTQRWRNIIAVAFRIFAALYAMQFPGQNAVSSHQEASIIGVFSVYYCMEGCVEHHTSNTLYTFELLTISRKK